MVQGNPNYDSALLTATFEKFLSRTPADAIFEDNVLIQWLNSRGKVKRSVDGGIKLLEPLMYGKSTAVGSYSGYDLLDVSPQEGFTNAEFEYKQYYATVAISGAEMEQNAGEAQVFNILEAKWKQAKMSLQDVMNEDAYLDGTGNGGKDITGLALMVDSAGTYGNIARADNAWWSAQETAVSGPLTIDGTNGMRRMYNDCSLGKGNRTPNFILTDQDEFEAYEQLMAPYLRYSIGGEANAAFQSDSLKFRRATMAWDEECQAGVMYFLNSEFISFNVRRDMRVTPFQTPHNQDAKSAKVLWMGELTASNCRHLGKLTGLTD